MALTLNSDSTIFENISFNAIQPPRDGSDGFFSLRLCPFSHYFLSSSISRRLTYGTSEMALISQFLSYFCPSPIIFSPPCPSLLLARNHKRGIIRNVKRMNAFPSFLFRNASWSLQMQKIQILRISWFFTGSKDYHRKKGVYANLILLILVCLTKTIFRDWKIYAIIWKDSRRFARII